MGGGGPDMPVPIDPNQANSQVDDLISQQAGSLIESLLPSVDDIAKILKDNNFNVTDQNELLIDLTQIIRQNLNLSNLDLTIP